MIARQVTIFEVGARDGLQKESRPVSLHAKDRFVRGLLAAGLTQLEVGAFVREDKVPQMADTAELFQKLSDIPSKASLWSLVPNRKGLERALYAGAKNLALFTAATDGFTTRNIGMTVDESFEEFKAVMAEAKRLKKQKLRFRGYVSTAFGCPFEGKVPAKKALKVVERLAKLGVEQVSIGDTIGVATPNQVTEIVKPALKMLGAKKLALHFHDTRGTALANALRALELGATTLDASAGGLGGCPFAPGATGNLATEDLVYMLDGLGVKTGVDLKKLSETSLELAREMQRPLTSRYLAAYAASGR